MQKIQEQSRDMEEGGGILIFDTCGGINGSIIKIVWNVFEYKNHK